MAEKKEKEGKEKALKQAAKSNIVLYLFDLNKGIDQDDKNIIQEIKKVNLNILLVANKVDLVDKDILDASTKKSEDLLFVSMKDKINMSGLKGSIVNLLKISVKNSSPGLYNIKNLKHLNMAYLDINDIECSLEELELTAEKLKAAQKNISKVLDNEDDERVLSGIFSNFCIGK